MSHARSPAKRLRSLWDAVALTRPMLLIPVWTMHVLGAAHASEAGSTAWAPEPRFIALSLAHTFLMAAAYVLNQLTDVETDAANRKLFLIAGGYVSRRFVKLEIAVLLGLSAAVLLASGGLSMHIVAVFAASAALGAMYSAPPVRLKARPGFDVAANGIGYGCLAFAVGWLSVRPLTMLAVGESATYVLCVAATFMFTTVVDLDGDARAGARTSGVALGANRAAWVGVAFLVLAAAWALARRQWYAMPAVGLALPLYVRSASRTHRAVNDPSLTRVTQVVILALSAAAAFAMPLYVVWLAVVIAWTRWYYRIFFGLRYP